MIETELIGILGLVGLFTLLLLGVPVGLSMVCIGIVGNYALSYAVPYLRFEPYLMQFKTLLWNVVASYELSVIPLFILMGFLASHANLSRDLFQGINAIVGRFKGGVAMAAIGACAGFGAVCGSSLATSSTMGRVALPELRRLNYSLGLATGTLAAGGTLGILIPPSVALIIYAIIVEASIIEMFQAAVLPGILAIVGFIVVIIIIVRTDPRAAPEPNPMIGAERRRAIFRLIPVLLIFGAIILGLGMGIFTPTPAAGVGVFAIFSYGLLLRFWGKGLTLSGIKRSLLDTAITSGMIYFILFGAEIIKSFFTRAGLPAALANWSTSSGMDPWFTLTLMLILLILLGCFIESLSMILVVVPFFWPALVVLNGGDYVAATDAAFGMDSEQLKIWFGILALVVVELGLITPPVGLNVFIISSLSKDIPMKTVFRGVMPFFSAEVIRIALIIAFPAITLFLPNFLSG